MFKLTNFWIKAYVFRGIRFFVKVKKLTLTLNIYDVSSLVCSEVGGQMFNSLLLEGTREHVSRSTTDSRWISHLFWNFRYIICLDEFLMYINVHQWLAVNYNCRNFGTRGLIYAYLVTYKTVETKIKSEISSIAHSEFHF